MTPYTRENKISQRNKRLRRSAYTRKAKSPIAAVQEIFKIFTIEAPYSEQNGMAVVSQQFVKDFGYPKSLSIWGEYLNLVLPMTLELKVDVRIPLP